jgi:hypothetical protein
VIRAFLRARGTIPPSLKGAESKKNAIQVYDAPAVDSMILEDYCLRDHPGPTKEYMPISWASPMRHAWNLKVIQLLAAEFRENVRTCQYQKMTTLPNDGSGQHSVFNIILRKLSSHQATLQQTARKRTKAGNLSQLEFNDMMRKQQIAEGVKKRRAERKKNVSSLEIEDSLLIFNS